MPDSERLISPWWTLALPPLALMAVMAALPARRMEAALAAAAGFALLQWTLPRARFRSLHYLGPVNIALFLFLVKLVVIPALIELRGPESKVLSFLPSFGSMQGVLWIELVTCAAFCLGVSLGPARVAPAGEWLRGPEPGWTWIAVLGGMGMAGFLAAFGNPMRILDYILSQEEFPADPDSSILALASTFLRPFLAFALIGWWALAVRRARGVSLLLVTLTAALGVTMANMTFGFNRAAFVFPLLSLVTVFSARVRRIPPAWFLAAAAVGLPLLIGMGMMRSSRMVGGTKMESTWWESMTEEMAENVQAYATGPQFTAIYCDRLNWGEAAQGGRSLLGSAFSPVPVLGKLFRDESGPILFNLALYDVPDIVDQILPLNIELYANFHLPGVIAGFLILGRALAWAESRFHAAESTFLAFGVQYIALWCAMLAAWSLAIVSQVAIYFFGPLYFYVAMRRLFGTKAAAA